MAERAVFLDRDDTIIENDGYLGDPAKVKLLPGAAAALAAMRGLGYRLIVVSNQSGVARGMFNEAAVESVNDEMNRQLKENAGSYVDASYYCPYHPEAPLAEYRVDHDWRKPRSGMLTQAAADFGLDLAQCWMVGDQERDIAAGTRAGCRTILLRDADRMPKGSGGGVDALELSDAVSPNFVVKTLADAARIIAREGKNPVPSPSPDLPSTSAGRSAPADGAGAAAESSRNKATLPRAAAEDERKSAKEKRAPAVEAPPSGMGKEAGDAESLPANNLSTLPRERPFDEAALAARIAQSVSQRGAAVGGAGGINHQLEQRLDELVTQLRQQNRNAELRPEFSLTTLLALLAQAGAIVCLAIGLANHFSTKATYEKMEDFFFAQQSHASAMTWILAAITFQGMAIALMLYSRQK